MIQAGDQEADDALAAQIGVGDDVHDGLDPDVGLAVGRRDERVESERRDLSADRVDPQVGSKGTEVPVTAFPIEGHQRINIRCRELLAKCGHCLAALLDLLADIGFSGRLVALREFFILEEVFQPGTQLLVGFIRKMTQFPNYEAVLPRDNNKHVVIERNELNDAVKRVAQLADQRSHAVKLSVTQEGVEISASSPEYGEAKETLEKEYKGEPLAIGFNADYMLDFLAAAAEGPISLELKDEQSAGQMRPLAEEAYRYRYIIMPMRI